tara:strand:- start:1039 stop:2040 length:1002 start_codon:yes stop_codon:yes gene_type:complete
LKKAQILITGASGCVGQYITSWLLTNSDANLLLWVRNPEKITAFDIDQPRIKVIIGDLRQPSLFAEDISKVTRVIHTATAWGDPTRAYEVNVIAVEKLLNLLNSDNIEQIIYFSTASILRSNLTPLPEAFRYGTEYIQSKAKCFEALQKHPLSGKIIAIFPTLVFGGRLDNKSLFPTSYLTEGLNQAAKWLWIARWFKAFSKFHFIHAADIAFVCGHLATTDHQFKRDDQSEITKIVLGQEAISIDQAINILLKWRGLNRPPSLPLWTWLIELLVKILPIEITNWDRHSIRQRHFVHHPITNPESFGQKSYAKSLTEVLSDSGLKRLKKAKRG